MTDPRFDPRFQRGYEGPDPETVIRAPKAPKPPVAVIPPPPVLQDAEPEPSVDAAAVEEWREPSSRFAVHNPFRLVLLIAGFVLLAAAVATLNAQVALQQQQFSGDQTLSKTESQLQNFLVYTLPQPLFEAGLISVIIWLALGALDAGVQRAHPGSRADE